MPRLSPEKDATITTLFAVVAVLMLALMMYVAIFSPKPKKKEKVVRSETTATIEETNTVALEPIAPDGETWSGPVEATVYGGVLDKQPVAYPLGGMSHTSELDAAGVYYFASRNTEWVHCWIEFRYGDKIIPAVMVDFGPAEWTDRMFDLGPRLSADLGYEADEPIFWRFYNEK